MQGRNAQRMGYKKTTFVEDPDAAGALDKDNGRGARYEGQFFKTKVCMFWEKGLCTRGYGCKYAHGGTEINIMPDLTNTSLCPAISKDGHCNRPNCTFAHSLENLRATQKFYKTSMCSFSRFGRCRMASECRHAHDLSELRPMPDGEVAPVQVPSGRREMGRAGRSGGRAERARHAVKGRKEEAFCSEDENDDLGSLPTWERTETTPAMMGGWGTSNCSPGVQPRMRSMDLPSTTKSWADLSKSDDEDEDLDSAFGADMWVRMQTDPVKRGPAHQSNQGYGGHGIPQSGFGRSMYEFDGPTEQDYMNHCGRGVAPSYGSPSSSVCSPPPSQASWSRQTSAAVPSLTSIGSQTSWSRQTSAAVASQSNQIGSPQGDGLQTGVMMVMVPVPVAMPVHMVKPGDRTNQAFPGPAMFDPLRLNMYGQAQMLQNAAPEYYED